MSSNQTDHNPHYYACCAFGWRTAETLDEAITGLTRGFESDIKNVIKNQRSNDGVGMYIWTCRVDDEPGYSINFYQPEGVPTAAHQEFMITRVTKSHIDLIEGNPGTRRLER